MTAVLIVGIITFTLGVLLGYVIGVQSGLKIALKANLTKPSRLPYYVAITLSCIFVVSVIGTTSYTVYFLSNSRSTTGVVTKLKESKSESGTITHFPIFEYYDANDDKYESRSSLNDETVSIGDTVAIRYLTKHPNSARIDSFLNHWLASFILMFLAFFSVLASVFFNIQFKEKSAAFAANKSL